MPNFTGLWTPTQQLQARSLNIWPAPPGAPTSVVATAGISSVSVAFTAPADTGFPANTITSFTATSSPGGFTASGASSPLTVVGLTVGTAYTFTVTATNESGTGPASSASSSATPVDPNYIDDMFSTYLYTGNGSTQTITNGVNLSANDGLVWIRSRNGSGATRNNRLWTTNLTGSKTLQSDSSAALYDYGSTQVTFNSNGVALSSDAGINANGDTYVSWTFRKQAKFFDVVTYTGNGVAGREIAHNLGSAPGCIIVKCTSDVESWKVYHRSLGSGTGNGVLRLNTTDADQGTGYGLYNWGNNSSYIAPTSTVFTVATDGSINASARTYVAYLWAHDAGGFGLSGTDNVVSCGSYTGNGSSVGPTVTLGYEPQWIMIKKASAISGSEGWVIWDNVRNSGLWNDWLLANDSQAEQVNNTNVAVQITPTGFFPNATNNTSNSYVNTSGSTYIYIAIRRPMKPPTLGTSVFAVSQAVEPQSSALFAAGFSDMVIHSPRVSDGGNGHLVSDRLRGNGIFLLTNTTAADNDQSGFPYIKYDSNAGAYIPASGYYNNSGGGSSPYVMSSFRRAPGFFDIVTYAGTGASSQTKTHNLGVTPELMIVKQRTAAFTQNWAVYPGPLGTDKYMFLNTTAAAGTFGAYWGNTPPTSTGFTVGNYQDTNASTISYVAYLFATLAGVSKVGSYTGTGATQTINCGFTGGARWVMIKRTDSTGDWYYWNSASGIVAGNDPYLVLNSDAAQITNTDYIDTYSAGFELSSTAPAAINASGGTYIFLAIA